MRGKVLGGLPLLIAAVTVGAGAVGCSASSGTAISGSTPTGTASAATATAARGATSTAAPAGTGRSQATGGSAPTSTPPVSTVTRTLPGTTHTVGPPPATSEPPAQQGDCPYLDADVVSQITGQHHGSTQVTAVPGLPICTFYRSDGGWMASVRFVKAESPAQAVAAVNQYVPVNSSQPADQPNGWVGGSTTKGSKVADATDALSVYAVSRGPIAVVAKENESPSIKARVIAVCAIYGAGLQQGQAPDYCRTS